MIAIFLIVLAFGSTPILATYFCYQPHNFVAGTTAACDISTHVYYAQVQLCCSTYDLGTTYSNVQRFETLPNSGESGSIPSNCQRPSVSSALTMICADGFTLYTSRALCCRGEPNFTSSAIGSTRSQYCASCCRAPVSSSSTTNQKQCPDTHPLDTSLNLCCGYMPLSQASFSYGTTSTNNFACVDKAVPGRASDCPSRESLCNVPGYESLMNEQCPFTCKKCGTIFSNGTTLQYSQYGGGSSTTLCVDKNAPGRPSDCADRADLCDDPNYKTLMEDQCPVTCKMCGNIVTNANRIAPGYSYSDRVGTAACTDKINILTGKSDCPDNASKCNDPEYKKFMDIECRYTCKRCNQNITTSRENKRPATTTTTTPSTSEVGSSTTATTNANILPPPGLILPPGLNGSSVGNTGIVLPPGLETGDNLPLPPGIVRPQDVGGVPVLN